jgi:mRNA interferase HigB
MKLIGKKLLFEFSGRHADVAEQVSAWSGECEMSSWNKPSDIKERYATASFISDNRVLFNIKGNKYRIEAKIDYQRKIVLVKRIGTHKEYDLWNL